MTFVFTGFIERLQEEGMTYSIFKISVYFKGKVLGCQRVDSFSDNDMICLVLPSCLGAGEQRGAGRSVGSV